MLPYIGVRADDARYLFVFDLRLEGVSDIDQNLEIFVLDTETTGLVGCPNDHIVDVAVCRVRPYLGTVEPVMSTVVGHDVSKWPQDQKEAWIFENTDLTLDDVMSATPAPFVAAELQSLLEGRMATSFNVKFDFDRFLYHRPWSLQGRMKLTPCIMLSSMPVCRIPGTYDQYKWPRLQEAYDMLVDGDPAQIGEEQRHRALEDAVMASYVLIELIRRGLY